MEEGAATMSRGRGTCHEIPARLFMTRWKRLCVGSEAAQSVFIAEDVKPAVIDFFFAEPRRLKNPNH